MNLVILALIRYLKRKVIYLFKMDSTSENEFSAQNISHILARQIQKDLDGMTKTPKTELITAGADSHIYLVKSSGRDRLIAKLYDVSPLNLGQIQEYADKTNWLKAHLEQTPYIAEVALSGEPWVTKFAVNEVLITGIATGVPYTLSPFVSGQDFEQMVHAAQTEKSKPYLMVQSDSGSESPFSIRDILDLHQQAFDLRNPNRVELDFNRHINYLLNGTNYNVQPLNIKIRVNINTRNITFIITDVAGSVAKAVEAK